MQTEEGQQMQTSEIAAGRASHGLPTSQVLELHRSVKPVPGSFYELIGGGGKVGLLAFVWGRGLG